VEQHELLRYVVDVLEVQRVSYMLVGSLASGVFGEPRLTQDIDILVELSPDQIQALCDAFPAPEFYVSVGAARQAVAQRGQFNVIHPASGNKIDFMIARSDSWGRSQISRRRSEQILPGRSGFVASPEDVILGKMWYYREGGSEKHLRDIAAIMQVSGQIIDLGYVARWAEQLELSDVWQAILNRLKDL
jgi:hypothetical protein